jgi:hypothetical protein
MAHSNALRKMMMGVIKDKRILSQLEFYEVYNNRKLN